MTKLSKRLKSEQAQFDSKKKYTISDALKIIVDSHGKAKFDESIDLALHLGIDPKQSQQQVRGAVSLPHGLGKDIRILVFAKGEKEQEAKDAGASFVGDEELINKIKGGWLDFDRAIATPDIMPLVSRVAKVLGPRGLMPNPKTGTVTFDIKKAVQAEKKGKLNFRIDKNGIIHASFGRRSLGMEKLKENLLAIFSAILKAKPDKSKGVYLKKLTISSTMGMSIELDLPKAQGEII